MTRALLSSVVVLLSFIAGPRVQASLIQVDSQTYHIGGSAESIGGPFLTYGKTEAVPVTGSKTSTGSDGFQVTDGYAYSSSKDYEVKTITQSFYGGSGDAHAEATWVFHPLATPLTYSFTSTISRSGVTQATLTDTTAGVELLNRTYGSGTLTEDYPFSLDLGHQYTLWISAKSTTTSGTDSPKMTVAITPEPVAALGTAFSLMFATALRRRSAR